MNELITIAALVCIYYGLKYASFRLIAWLESGEAETQPNADDAYTIDRMSQYADDEHEIF